MAVILVCNAKSSAATYNTVITVSTPGAVYSGSLFQNGDIYNKNIIIEARTEVIITDKSFSMGPHTIIYIEPTATLVLAGTTITGTNTSFSATSSWWNGIEVMGTISKHQPTVANVKSGAYTTGIGSSYYNQGAVWIHQGSGGASSEISYSQYGVYAGSIPYGPTALFPGGGGVVICEKSNFINNYYYSVYFDDYPSFPYTNISYISGCSFSWDGSHGTGTAQGFITAHNNVFSPTYPTGGDFDNNYFEVLGFTYNPATMSPSQYGCGKYGMLMDGCGYSAGGLNQLEQLYGGICNNSTIWGQTLNFNWCSADYYGIIENGGPLSYLNNSDINIIGQYGVGSPYVLTNASGIYVNGATSFSAQGNDLSSYYAPGYVRNIYGMYIKNTGNYGNIINFNTAEQIPVGISAEGNNTGTLLKCNDLSGVEPQYCVTVTSGNIAKVQGNKNTPAGNKFGNYTYSAYEDFYRYTGSYLGVSGIDYYYNPGSHENPQYHTSNINPHSILGTITCGFLSYGYSPAAGVISTINSDIASLPPPGTGTTDQQNQYSEDLFERQYYIGAACRGLMAFDTVSASPDTLQLQKNIQKTINFVKTQGDQVDSFLLINLYIAKQTYDSASSIISTLSSAHSSDNEIVNYCNFYSMYITGLEDSFNTSWQGSDTSTLQTMAATTTMASASAQSLLQYVRDRRILYDTTDTAKVFTALYPPTFQYATDTGGAAPEEAGINSPAKATMFINAWPDPVTDNLQIEISNPTNNSAVLHVTVMDNLGKTVIDQTLQAGMQSDLTHEINVSALAKGVYILSITDYVTLLHKQTIIKQ